MPRWRVGLGTVDSDRTLVSIIIRAPRAFDAMEKAKRTARGWEPKNAIRT